MTKMINSGLLRPCALVVVVGLLVAAIGSASAGTILSDSFESPVVTGSKVTIAPEGWSRQGDGASSSTSAGLANVDSGVFTTAFGSQAAHVWYDTAALVTEETTFKDALWTGITYTVTFNVAKDSSLAGGKYKVELIALSPDENRYSDDAGTILKSLSGTATTNDMSETVSFTYTAPVDSPHIGKLLALQIETGDKNTSGALVDNLVFSDDTVSDVVPPAILHLSPMDNADWVPIDETLVVTFNENVTGGSGNIEIRRTSDNSLVESFAIGSPRVSISGATVTIDPSADLDEGVEYYVLFDSGTVKDAANHDFALTDTTKWNFTTTQPDGIREIFYESFESPVVSGQGTNPTLSPGWTYTSTHSSNKLRVTLYNEDTGDFSTPYGEQAFYLPYNNYSGIVTDLGTINDVYQAGVTYTLKFNVAAKSGDAGNYKVQLMSFNPGDSRAALSPVGTVVAEVTGKAIKSDMRENDGIVFTVPEGAPYIGTPVDIRLIYGAYFLLDNLKLTDNTTGDTAPPAILTMSPNNNAEWVPVDEALVATFNEPVTNVSGNIEIRRTSDDFLVESIAVDSAQVSINDATVTIDPSVTLAEGVEYYVLFESGAIQDLAGNDYELADSTVWTFITTQPDGPGVLFYESFEDPVVSGMGPEPSYPTNGWLKGTHDNYVRLYNENSGDFSTPYGDQALMITYNNYAFIVTDSNTVNEVYREGVTYTLKFNAAVTNNSVARGYDVKLMYIPDGIVRTSYNNGGTVVASAVGTVSTSDMRENSGIVFTVPEGAAYIGKPIDIRINWGTGYCLIDNLKLTDDNILYPSVFRFR